MLLGLLDWCTSKNAPSKRFGNLHPSGTGGGAGGEAGGGRVGGGDIGEGIDGGGGEGSGGGGDGGGGEGLDTPAQSHSRAWNPVLSGTNSYLGSSPQ